MYLEGFQIILKFLSQSRFTRRGYSLLYSIHLFLRCLQKNIFFFFFKLLAPSLRVCPGLATSVARRICNAKILFCL